MKIVGNLYRPLEFEIPNLIDPLFKMTVDTTQAGSAADTFILRLGNGVTNLTVDWGDGTSDVITTYNQADLTHVYASSGTYQISLSGSFVGIAYGNTGDRLKVSSIDNWGNNQWTSMNGAFRGCSNMVANYSDSPDTALCSIMSYAFFNCTNFNGAVNFDTTNVTSMLGMFTSCINFNQPITFSTSTVTDMSNMFNTCTIFNQPITFDTSSVTKMDLMFRKCEAFDQTINFDGTALTNAYQMFMMCYMFNSSITITNSTLLTNCGYMFYQCSLFDAPIEINTTCCTRMDYMF